MKNFLLLFLFAMSSGTFAQRSGDIAIFSNSGQKFYVVLNGIRQNTAAETNVKVQGLTNDWYSCKIMAADNSFQLEKNIPVKKDTLITYQISSKKGKYKLIYFSETAMNSAPVTTGQSVVYYSPTETTGTTGTTGTVGTTGTTTTVGTTGTTGTAGTTGTTTTVGTTGTTTVGTTGTTGTVGTTTTVGTTGTTGTTTTTTTTGTTGTTGTTEAVNFNMNVSENGMTISMTGTGMEDMGDPQTTTTTGTTTRTTPTGGTTTTGMTGTTTTTSTTTTSSSNGNGTTTYYEETTTTTTTTGGGTGNLYQDEDVTFTMSTSGTGTGVGTTTTTTGTTGTTTTTGTADTRAIGYGHGGSCYMSDADFAALKQSVSAEAFSEDRMRVANLAAQNKCMSVAQIKEIMLLFSFSEEQLSFAKTAYDSCTNKGDYYQLMEVFSFSDDKEELENYIKNR